MFSSYISYDLKRNFCIQILAKDYNFCLAVLEKAKMSTEKPPLASGLARTRSEQLYETVAAAIKSPHGSMDANSVPATTPTITGSGGGTLSGKSSRRLVMGASPGRSGGAGTHIRKSRSAQLKLELDEVSSGAALSRASSASLGLSFSFTGFAMPPDEISDSNPFSDDEMIRKSSCELLFISCHFCYGVFLFQYWEVVWSFWHAISFTIIVITLDIWLVCVALLFLHESPSIKLFSRDASTWPSILFHVFSF